MGVSGNVKSFLGRVKLFKINKIFENTLSLRVAGNGTKKPATTYSCTCLLRTNRMCSISAHPVFSQAFVNFSQFNLDFHEFRNYLLIFHYDNSSLQLPLICNGHS